MPQAGWCRECERWVWVGEEGECQFGHEAASVESVHDQPDPTASDEPGPAPAPPAPVEGDFGSGEFPERLRRFNWGAFFLPFFWAIAYRSWPVLTAWFVAVMSQILIVSITGPLQGSQLTTLLGATVVAEIISGLCRIWAGLNANASLWKREATLRQLLPAYQSKHSVGRFTERQKVWTIVGAVVAVGGAVVLAPLEATIWKEYGLTFVGAAMPTVWLGAEVALAFWLDYRLRKDPPDVEASARDLA